MKMPSPACVVFSSAVREEKTLSGTQICVTLGLAPKPSTSTW